MSVLIAVENIGAPESGTEVIECSVPASRAAFQTAAATAISSQGGFMEITVVPPAGATLAAEAKLINVNKVRFVN